MAWYANEDNTEYCKVCRGVAEEGQRQPPCHYRQCEREPPPILPGNIPAWNLYQRVSGARHGDMMNTLDYQVMFRVMDLDGLDRETQLEIFEKVSVMEGELSRIKSEKMSNK